MSVRLRTISIVMLIAVQTPYGFAETITPLKPTQSFYGEAPIESYVNLLTGCPTFPLREVPITIYGCSIPGMVSHSGAVIPGGNAFGIPTATGLSLATPYDIYLKFRDSTYDYPPKSIVFRTPSYHETEFNADLNNLFINGNGRSGVIPKFSGDPLNIRILSPPEQGGWRAYFNGGDDFTFWEFNRDGALVKLAQTNRITTLRYSYYDDGQNLMIRPISITDPDGNVTTFQYKNLTLQVSGAGKTFYLRFGTDNLLNTVSVGDRDLYRFNYEGNPARLSSIDNFASLDRIKFGYASGNTSTDFVVTSVDRLAGTTGTTAVAPPVKFTYTSTSAAVSTFAGFLKYLWAPVPGRIVGYTDGGTSVTYTFGGNNSFSPNQVNTTVGPVVATENYTYNSDGSISSSTRGGVLQRTNSYTRRGQLTSSTRPDGSEEYNATYNDLNGLKTSERTGGIYRGYAYDGTDSNRFVKEVRDQYGSVLTQLKNNDSGLPTEIRDGSSVTNISYLGTDGFYHVPASITYSDGTSVRNTVTSTPIGLSIQTVNYQGSNTETTDNRTDNLVGSHLSNSASSTGPVSSENIQTNGDIGSKRLFSSSDGNGNNSETSVTIPGQSGPVDILTTYNGVTVLSGSNNLNYTPVTPP